MNQGGEPGHDDYGLPRVDIEIPDDARELYRDVQAYHRELRALRRHERSLRWRAPFRKAGYLIPVVAGCLILAIFAGLVLSMLTPGPYAPGPIQRGSARTPSASSGTSASASTAPAATTTAATPAQTTVAPLPGTPIYVAGKAVPLRTLTSTALLVIPANCACSTAVRQLLAQAKSARVPVYLVGPPALAPALSRLAAAPSAGRAIVATDRRHVLAATYRPAGLTALLVDSAGAVTMDRGLLPGARLQAQFRGLRPSG